MSQKLTAVWQQRWQALDDALSAMAKQKKMNGTIQATAACLHAFGKDQFNFFYDGFRDGWLLPSMYHPPEYVLRASLDQVGFDLSVLRDAAAQRQNDTMATALSQGDQLAQHALNVAVAAGMLPESVALTYVNKSPFIRVIPYAPVALVGIPHSCATVPRDYLAIPHEVGHYVYGHASGLAAHLHTQIPLDPPWFNNWIEEIFADVFGCLVAGPVIGLDFQDLLMDNATERFNVDDGEHPVDALRPYIYTTTLDRLGFKNAAAALTERWQALELKRNYPETFTPFGTNEAVKLVAARMKVEKVVENVLDYLLDTYDFSHNTYWTNDLPAGVDDPETLYASFERWLGSNSDLAVHELKEIGKQVGVELPDGKVVNKRVKGSTGTWRDMMKEACRKDGHLLVWPAWFPIFTAGFWPTKGPENNSDRGL